MKIAIWHNLPSGGGKRALYDQVKGLIQRGHVVESWYPPTADRTYLPLSDLITEHIVPLSWEPKKQRVQIWQTIQRYYDALDKLEAMDRHCQLCAEEINQGGFDLLFAHPCMFYGVTSISRYVKIPKVILLHEPHRRLYEALPRLPWLAPPPAKYFWWSPQYLRMFLRDLVEVQSLRVQAREEFLNAQAFDVILVNSFFSRESILRAYGLDAKVCYLGIDTEVFQNQQKSREDFVVGLGSLTFAKNIKFVVEALANVEEPRPSLVWIGNFVDNTYLEEIKQLAKSLNVDFKAKVGVDEQELVNVLNHALMMVYAPRLEPFGYAPLEANACGLPVIAVAEGGIRETVTNGINGLIVEPDTKVFATAIKHLVNNKDYADQLGQNGSKLVAEQWSLDVAIARLEQRLMQLVND